MLVLSMVELNNFFLKYFNVCFLFFILLAFPEFRVHPDTTINVRSQEQTILTCTAMGINTPTISWRVGEVDVESLNSSRLASYENGSLVINDTKFEDNSNSYSCVATNRVGSKTSTTVLNVTGTSVIYCACIHFSHGALCYLYLFLNTCTCSLVLVLVLEHLCLSTFRSLTVVLVLSNDLLLFEE